MTEFDLLIADARIVAPGGTIERGWVGISEGVIAEIGGGSPSASISARVVKNIDGAWLGPGFIDLHVHGSAGVDVMNTDDAGLLSLSRFFATRGVTAFLAGTYTLDHESTMEALQRLGRVRPQVRSGAHILGAYMEGPYLSHERKGAHREQHLRAIDRAEIAAYLDTGVVRAFVLAPELDDADWLIDELGRRQIAAVAGHTDATFAQIARAHDAGVVSITHTFNGMRGLHHREPGTAGAALLLDDLVCEVISDGLHLAPELMKLFWRMKGAEGIALITDAGIAGGLPDGRYATGDRFVTITGGVGRLDNGTISSSAKTFDHNFALFCRYAGVEFDQAWPSASSVPASIAGVADRKGSLEKGKDADLVVLTPEGVVKATVIDGEWLVDEEGTSQ